jgi:hypoxanthine phosphoribosyltransferase
VNEAVEVLVPEERLKGRVRELGVEISEHYAGRPAPLLVSVLKGSTVFLADLVRELSIDVEVDFMSLSSYGSTGVVRVIKDLDRVVEGQEVLIVEDIVDTGFTLQYLRKTLLARGAGSVATVTLLDKVARRIIPVPVEWKGFEIPDLFVLGYGLDFEGIYRNVRDIFVAPDIVRLAAEPGIFVSRVHARGSGNHVGGSAD